MPYHIGEEGTSGCSGFPVVKDSDGTVMGCHKTKEDAKKQLAALYINEPEANKSAGHVPPQEVRNNAKRGLELRKKYNRGGTEVGVARARDLSNGAALSLDTIKRMNSYFARHEVDKKGEGWGKDSAGYIAWLLWGGDAGWSWAKRILRENETKEKSTVNDLTTAFFQIVKSDKNADGTMMVYGKATDDSIDIDQQICDPTWLDSAMPDWFKSGGNIREQHSNIAAGVAKEYEKKADGHYIHALVVDPISVKKVDTGVLKGFSIGIKSPRIVRDEKAANGRIIDGQIVEVSLVDRPANPNCQLVLAKSDDANKGIWKVEELIEKADKKPDYASINEGGEKSEPSDKDLYNRVKAEAKEKFDVYPSAVANAWVVREYKKRGGKYKRKTEKSVQLQGKQEEYDMTTALEIVNTAKSLATGDTVKYDKKLYEDARTALAQLIVVEANEMDTEGHNEEMSLSHLLAAVHHLFAWYEGEKAEGEVMEEETIELAAGKDKELKPMKGETEKEYKARCKEAGMDDETIKAMCDKYMGAKEDAEKSADVEKCLECGCNQPGQTHGMDKLPDGSNVSTAVMVSPSETPKSAEATETELEEQELPVTEEAAPAEEADDAASKEDSTTENVEEEIKAIVEEAVKSATKSLTVEIANLLAAKEAASEKAVGLETELAAAKSLAVAGGPKRTIKPIDHASNDLLVKAATYKAKADATTDPDLAKGYKALYEEFLKKSAASSESN
jgi:hypothetical protein